MSAARSRQPATLRTQILAEFGALVLSLALLLTLLLGFLMRQHAQQHSAAELHDYARNAAMLLAEGLLERSREVDVLSRAEILWREGLDSPTVVQLLARNQAMRPNSVWIGVADTDGVVRAATDGLLVGRNVRERPWFQAGLQQLFVGDVHDAKLLASRLPAPASGEPLRFLDFAAPVRVGGRTLGVLGIHGSWDWARQVIEGLLPADATLRGLQLFIFDREGTLIYAPDGRTEALRDGGQSLPLLPAPGDGAGHTPVPRVVAWADGARYLTAAVNLEPRNAASDLGWRVVAREPEEVALAASRRALQLSLALGLVAALVASGLGWLAARRVSRELYLLADAAGRVEQGAGVATIPTVRSNREVMTLSDALRRMTQRLLSANEEMEQQVRQRTRELEAANRELDQLVRHDALTGVLNRRGFEQAFAQAQALARRGRRPLSLLMVDADHFKRVNDTYGHDVGDEILRFLAQAMVERLRTTDVVARLGGEEFVALLPDTGREAARVVAQALIDHIAAQRHPRVGQVTISVGLATHAGDGPGADAESLLRQADEALYEAKHQGRNRVVARV